MKPFIQGLFLVILLPMLACSQNKQGDLQSAQTNENDLLVINAKIWTADPDETKFDRGVLSTGAPIRDPIDAMVIRKGRFIYVGDERMARKVAEKNARILDARGRRILPGLIDSHIHLIDGGLQLSRVNLRDVPDRAAFIATIKKRAEQTKAGQWIQGGRWSTESWPDPTQPRKEWIDAVTPNNPVLLSRMDGHGALANSIALAKAGIDKNGPADPPGGQIERDPTTKEPTGILKDAAIELVAKLIPKPTDDELDAGLSAAMKHANQHGITCVHTMSEFRHLASFERARKRGNLTVRIRLYISENDWLPFIDEARKHENNDWVSIAGFKAYADGSLGSRTALMHQPYADNPPDNANWRGLSRLDRQTEAILAKGMTRALLCDFAPAIHCIGDAATEEVLWMMLTCADVSLHTCRYPYPRLSETYDTTEEWLKSLARRPRIEHAQHLSPTEIPRFAQLGVVASMQPLHKADDARYAEKAIGPERCKTSYAFRSLLDAGALVAFGSDWPVVSLDPFLGVRAAVTGLSLDNKLFVPEQNITVEEALTCYTRNAARAAGDQDSLGMIRAGYLADFVILADDPFTIDPKNLGEFRGDTYVAGKLVASTSTNPPASVKHASAYPPSAEPDRTSHACHCCNRSSPARSSKQKMGGMGNRSRGLDLHCKSDHRESVEHRAQE